MHRIVYISTANGLAPSDIAAIVDTAVRRNRQNGVTGFLLYNGRNFLQLIEGRRDMLEELMARLRHDPRHDGIVRVVDEPVDKLCCPQWEMHHLPLSESVAERRQQLEQALPPLDRISQRLVYNFAVLN